jgi:hypothetical protein
MKHTHHQTAEPHAIAKDSLDQPKPTKHIHQNHQEMTESLSDRTILGGELRSYWKKNTISELAVQEYRYLI